MDIFDKLDRAHTLYDKWVLINEYIYPILIIVGLVLAFLVIRSFVDGKRIRSLEKGVGGNSGQGTSINIHCQTANILQTTPSEAQLLIGGRKQPNLLQSAQSVNVAREVPYSSCSSCGKQNFVYHRFCRLCGKPLLSTIANQPEATTGCSHCDYARKVN